MAGISFEGPTQQAGQPAAVETSQQGSASTNATAGETAAQEQGLTETRMRAILAEEIVNALDKARREAQSLTAKSENRIKTEVQRQVDLLKKAGVPVGADQAQAIEKVIRQQEAEPTDPSQPDTAAQPAAAVTEPETHSSVDAQADAIMDALKVDLDPADPEAATLDRSSEKNYLASLVNALLAKQSRVANARMPAGGGTPASGSATAHLNGKQTLDSYYRSKR